MGRLTGTFLALAGVVSAAMVLAGDQAVAQQSDTGQPAAADADFLDELRSCQGLSDDTERLACFDAKVAGLIAANEAGDVQMVDREDVRQTRRSLFGFRLPELGIFGGNDDAEEDELFTTTISSVRYFGRTGVRFTTAEGAVWEMNNVPSRLRTIKPGDTAEFKKASLGFFFVRIEGQMGVKGKRIE